MCIFLCGKEGGAHKRKKTHQTDEKIREHFSSVFSFNSWLSMKVLQASLLFYTTNKNASATHLHDLLGTDDEEKRASGGEQRDEAVSF